VLLKGAALAHSVYPEPHLRPMADIDVWVPSAELLRAVRCLLDHGFEIPEGGLADGRLSPTLSQHRLRAVGVGVRVELHGMVHSLECLSPDRAERFRRRAEPLRIGDANTQMLCPEDALVHTCLHLAMTNRFANSQLPLFDVFLLTDKRSTQIDWTGIARAARTDACAVYVTLALRLARTVWGARVPDEYFEAIGHIEDLDELEHLALEQVWEPNPDLPPVLERLLRLPTSPARLSAIIHRMFVQPWQPPVDGQRRGWNMARGAAEHWMNDLTVKVPRYFRAWASGALSRRELNRRAALAKRRGRIGALVRRSEAQLPGTRRQ
jgi:hypothetical protein